MSYKVTKEDRTESDKKSKWRNGRTGVNDYYILPENFNPKTSPPASWMLERKKKVEEIVNSNHKITDYLQPKKRHSKDTKKAISEAMKKHWSQKKLKMITKSSKTKRVEEVDDKTKLAYWLIHWREKLCHCPGYYDMYELKKKDGSYRREKCYKPHSESECINAGLKEACEVRDRKRFYGIPRM